MGVHVHVCVSVCVCARGNVRGVYKGRSHEEKNDNQKPLVKTREKKMTMVVLPLHVLALIEYVQTHENDEVMENIECMPGLLNNLEPAQIEASLQQLLELPVWVLVKLCAYNLDFVAAFARLASVAMALEHNMNVFVCSQDTVKGAEKAAQCLDRCHPLVVESVLYEWSKRIADIEDPNQFTVEAMGLCIAIRYLTPFRKYVGAEIIFRKAVAQKDLCVLAVGVLCIPDTCIPLYHLANGSVPILLGVVRKCFPKLDKEDYKVIAKLVQMYNWRSDTDYAYNSLIGVGDVQFRIAILNELVN